MHSLPLKIQARIVLFFLGPVLVSPSLLHAESVFNLLVENDVISGDDRHYTSGVMLNYVSGLDEGPKRLRDLGIFVPGLERDDKMHVALSIGHEIYTPTDITTPNLLEDERPYAGHVFVGAGFITENEDEVETWRLSIGF